MPICAVNRRHWTKLSKLQSISSSKRGNKKRINNNCLATPKNSLTEPKKPAGGKTWYFLCLHMPLDSYKLLTYHLKT